MTPTGYLVFVYTTGWNDTPQPKKVLYKTFDAAIRGAYHAATEQADMLEAEIEAPRLINPRYYTDNWGSVELFHLIKRSETIGVIKVEVVYSERT